MTASDIQAVNTPKTTHGLRVAEVTTAAQLTAFVDLPWQLYRHDPLWVPPLKTEVAFKLNRAEHPYYQHADLTMFLATRQGQAVGRIAVCVNHNHNAFHQEKTAFFGFFECIQDTSVSSALFNAAEGWVAEQGGDRILGPFSMSIDDEVGFLLNGYDRRPVMQMPYNPPYYHELCVQHGFTKAKDLLAWRKPFDDKPVVVPDALKALKFSILSLRPAELASELDRIMELYNATFTRHWGYVPLTREEVRQMHDDLKEVLDPELIFFGEVSGEVVAFGIALPDYNQVLARLDGKLGLAGMLKFLWWKRKISGVRAFVVGVDPAFRETRLASLMMDELNQRGYQRGYQWFEMSWTLEDNTPVNRLVESAGAEHYKTYRVYEKCL